MSSMRLRDAAASSVRFDDIRVAAAATTVDTTDGRQVRVQVTVDPSTLSLAEVDGRWTGALDLMILCADAQDRAVGVSDQHMKLDMSRALYEQARVAGIPYAATVPVTGPARRVKVIVYNYETDRLGTAIVEVK
jgi:hypothetical protein